MTIVLYKVSQLIFYFGSIISDIGDVDIPPIRRIMGDNNIIKLRKQGSLKLHMD